MYWKRLGRAVDVVSPIGGWFQRKTTPLDQSFISPRDRLSIGGQSSRTIGPLGRPKCEMASAVADAILDSGPALAGRSLTIQCGQAVLLWTV